MHHHEFKYMRLVFAVGPLVVLLLVALFLFEAGPQTEASTSENMYGYAWSSNIGWVKFNDCEDPGDPATCAVLPDPSFGVKVDPPVAGISQLSGYAWSNNVGWLSFDAPIFGGLRPSAYLNTATNELRGWARFCSAATNPATCDGSIGPAPASGGWDGWVSLNCLDGGNCVSQPYRVSLSGCSTFSGYAWGGDVVGWIKFRNDPLETAFGVSVSNLGLPPPPPTNTAIDNLGSSAFYCTTSPNVYPSFGWDYVDPCGARPQTAFRIQVAQDSNGIPEAADFSPGNLRYDTCDPAYNSEAPPFDNTCLAGWFNCPSGSRCAYTPSPSIGVPELIYNRVAPNGYVLRMKSFNLNGESDWSNPVLFDIPPVHAYPKVAFSYLPSKPFIDEPVTFDSVASGTSCYTVASGGKSPTVCPISPPTNDPSCPIDPSLGGERGYEWNFDLFDVNPLDPNRCMINPTPDPRIPVHTYTQRGGYTARLQVVHEVIGTDVYSCSKRVPVDINVQFRIPDWREIAP